MSIQSIPDIHEEYPKIICIHKRDLFKCCNLYLSYLSDTPLCYNQYLKKEGVKTLVYTLYSSMPGKDTPLCYNLYSYMPRKDTPLFYYLYSSMPVKDTPLCYNLYSSMPGKGTPLCYNLYSSISDKVKT
jgi:hypothetical protein